MGSQNAALKALSSGVSTPVKRELMPTLQVAMIVSQWCLGGEEADLEHGELLFFTVSLRV